MLTSFAAPAAKHRSIYENDLLKSAEKSTLPGVSMGLCHIHGGDQAEEGASLGPLLQKSC